MNTNQENPQIVEKQEVLQESLLEEIVQATRLRPADEAYSITRKGVEALISQLLEPGREAAKVSKASLDGMIAEIDRKLSLQVDEILHNLEFQQIESAWRSLEFLMDRTDPPVARTPNPYWPSTFFGPVMEHASTSTTAWCAQMPAGACRMTRSPYTRTGAARILT